MYGIINICMRDLLILKFGESTWDKIRENADVDDTFLNYDQYNDDVTYRIVRAAADIQGVTTDNIWELFGVYWVVWLMKSGYDSLIRTLGWNLPTFLSNLDFLHSVYMKTMYPNMSVPQFRVDDIDDTHLRLHYYSVRLNLAGMVLGIVKGVSRIIFHTDIMMEQIGFKLEDYIGIEKSHYTFLITLITTGLPEIGYGGIVKEKDWTSIFDRNMPHSPTDTISDSGKCPFSNMSKGLLKHGLQTTTNKRKIKIPEQVLLDGQTFCFSFPYHIVFDKNMVIKHCGAKLQDMCPRINEVGAKVTEFIVLRHPVISLNVENVKQFIHSIFMAEIIQNTMDTFYQNKPAILIRGQMIWIESYGYMVFLCSPRITNLQDLRDRGMHFSDIAPHDITRDLVLFNQQREVEVELAKQLEQKKEELRLLMKDLEVEKHKTDTLLYSMLPKEVANELREGRPVEAGEYSQVTILFSDIVHFTDICSICHPMQIVHLLNDMYVKFDELTNVHGVYKVETIGDAYMVVGGLPIQDDSHAECVTKFALDQQHAVKNVLSPVKGDAIQIRVGVHTGRVVAGVVGVKIPRYCLFGDTVNTASRMESNGVAGKVHCSEAVVRMDSPATAEDTPPGSSGASGGGNRCFVGGCSNRAKEGFSVYGLPAKTASVYTGWNTFLTGTRKCLCLYPNMQRALEGNFDFSFTFRDEINVKGKGIMKTYFVNIRDGDDSADIFSDISDNIGSQELKTNPKKQLNQTDPTSRKNMLTSATNTPNALSESHNNEETRPHAHQQASGNDAVSEIANKDSRICEIL